MATRSHHARFGDGNGGWFDRWLTQPAPLHNAKHFETPLLANMTPGTVQPASGFKGIAVPTAGSTPIGADDSLSRAGQLLIRAGACSLGCKRYSASKDSALAMSVATPIDYAARRRNRLKAQRSGNVPKWLQKRMSPDFGGSPPGKEDHSSPESASAASRAPALPASTTFTDSLLRLRKAEGDYARANGRHDPAVRRARGLLDPPELASTISGTDQGRHIRRSRLARKTDTRAGDLDHFRSMVHSEISLPTAREQDLIAAAFRSAMKQGVEGPEAQLPAGKRSPTASLERASQYALRSVVPVHSQTAGSDSGNASTSGHTCSDDAGALNKASSLMRLDQSRFRSAAAPVLAAAVMDTRHRGADMLQGPPLATFWSPLRRTRSSVSTAESNFLRPPSLKDEYNVAVSATDVLVQACRARGIVAESLLGAVEEAGRVGDLRLPHHALGDDRAVALARALTAAQPRLRELDLRANRLTPIGSSNMLLAAGTLSGLQVLDMSENSVQGAACTALCTVIQSAEQLREIRLSNCSIGDAQMQLIGKALIQARHNQLSVLKLSRNKLGADCGTVMAEVMSRNRNLTSYDLSWNAIRGKAAVAIAEALEGNAYVERLDLSFNGFAEAGTMALGISLAENNRLQSLSLTHNSIMPRAALVLALGIASNTALRQLAISGNTLGKFGGRAFIRTAINNGNLDLGLEQTNLEVDDYSDGAFHPSNPQGKRTLRLDDLYGRAVATELIRIFADNPGVRIESLQTEVTGVACDVTLRRKLVPYADDDGIEKFRSIVVNGSGDEEWSVPTGGVMRVSVSMRREKAQVWQTASAKAVRGMVRMLARKTLTQDERSTLVKLAAEDMAFTGAQAATIVNEGAGAHEDKYESRHAMARVDMARSLMASIIDEDGQHEFINTALDKEEKESFAAQIGQLADFSLTNPTSHYRLDMADPNDRQLLNQLLELNNVEVRVGQALGGSDTSQFGDWENFRNCFLNSDPFRLCGSSALPLRGVFEFDYVSTARPSSDCTTLSHADVVKIIRGLSIVLDLPEWPFLQPYYVAAKKILAGTDNASFLPPVPEDREPGPLADPGPFRPVCILSLKEAVEVARAISKRKQAGSRRRLSLIEVPKLSAMALEEQDADNDTADSGTAHGDAEHAATPSARASSGVGALEPNTPHAGLPPFPPASQSALFPTLQSERRNTAQSTGPGDETPPQQAPAHPAILGSENSSAALPISGVHPCQPVALACPDLPHTHLGQTPIVSEIDAVGDRVTPPIPSESQHSQARAMVVTAGGPADSSFNGPAPSHIGAACPLPLPQGPKAPRSKESSKQSGGVLARATGLVDLAEGGGEKELRKAIAKIGLTGRAADAALEMFKSEEVSNLGQEQSRSTQSTLGIALPAGQRRLSPNNVPNTRNDIKTALDSIDGGAGVTVTMLPAGLGRLDPASCALGLRPAGTTQKPISGSDVPSSSLVSPDQGPAATVVKKPFSGEAASGSATAAAIEAAVAAATSPARTGDSQTRHAPAVTSDAAIFSVAAFAESGVMGSLHRSTRESRRKAAEQRAAEHRASSFQEAERGRTSVKHLRAMTSELYVTTEQADTLVRLIPPHMHQARVEALVALFSRISDISTFWRDLAPLVGEWEWRKQLGKRLGWLNVVNPHHAEGFFHLELFIPDEHKLVETLVVLAVIEPGPNIVNEEHAHHGYWFPGWRLPATWVDRIPPIGQVKLTYVSDQPGCAIIPSARRILAKRFLVGRPAPRHRRELIGMYDEAAGTKGGPEAVV